MVRPCAENVQVDTGVVGDENAHHNIQMPAVEMGKVNSIPCRRAMTPRERKSFTPSDAGRAVEEARFQKEHGEPLGTTRSRSTIDFGYVQPQEGDDKFSRSLRLPFYKPTPSRFDGRDGDASVQCASPRPMTPVKRASTPVKREKCVAAPTAVPGPTVDFGYVSPAEGDDFSRALRTASDQCKPWRPSKTVGSAPNLSPRRERKSTASDVSPSEAVRSSTPNRSKAWKPMTTVASAPNFSPRRERTQSEMTASSAPTVSPQRKRAPIVTSEPSTAVPVASNASPAKDAEVSTPAARASQLSPAAKECQAPVAEDVEVSTKECKPAAVSAQPVDKVLSPHRACVTSPIATGHTPECEVPAPNTPPAASQPQEIRLQAAVAEPKNKADSPDFFKNVPISSLARQRPSSAKGRERAAAAAPDSLRQAVARSHVAPQPAAAKGSERPATPERKVQERPTSAKGRERPATPERKVQERPASAKGKERAVGTSAAWSACSPPGRLQQRPASAERKVQARPASAERKVKPVLQERAASVERKVKPASPDVPVCARVLPDGTESADKAGPQRRSIAAMQKHLARQGAASPRLQHSASAAPELPKKQTDAPISKSVSAAKFFDTRERAALAKHLERAAAKTAAATAAASVPQKHQKPQAPVDAGSLVKTMQDKRRMRQGEASSPDASTTKLQPSAAQPAKPERVPLAAR